MKQNLVYRFRKYLKIVYEKSKGVYQVKKYAIEILIVALIVFKNK